MKTLLVVGVALVCLTFGQVNAGAQAENSLDRARALYDSASFDEALVVLDRVSGAQPESDVEEVQRYRALCLLALNRTSDAQRAIEIVFSRDPLFRLSDGDAPPRMRTAFNDVRRRLMPKVVDQLYASAKLTFDRKEYDLATTQFNDLLTFLEDGDTRDLPSLKEFRTLATGFRDLSQTALVTASKPAAAPAAEPKPIAQVPPAGQTAAAFNVPATTANTVAGQAASGTLEPPIVIRQQMPLWLGMRDFLPRGNRGTLRVIIDERGNVEEARVIESLHMVYDALLISATRTWKYEPAKLDGKPVRYVKMIEVVLKPQ
jgi:tetratricopeptide (TPR) repeat protein